jgi:Recombinase
MKMTERIRQAVSGPLDLDRIRSYEKEGWKLAALEWERQVDATETVVDIQEEPPYGTRVGANAVTLETDPNETDVLFAMMELIVEDGPYSRIAEELNRRGYRTRHGARWSPVSVFEMLPRLIDAGPKIFSTDRWHSRRSQEVRRR